MIKQLWSGMLGAVLILASVFSLAHQFLPQILRHYMPTIMTVVQDTRVSENDYAGLPSGIVNDFVRQAGGALNLTPQAELDAASYRSTGRRWDASSLYASSPVLALKPGLSPFQSAGPTSGNWHGGMKEFTLDLTSGGAAGTYTLATSRNLSGNGNGVQIVFINFYCMTGQGAVGGTAVTVQSNDTTSVQYLASTVTANITQGKNVGTFNTKTYLGTGTAITFTTTGTFSAGQMVVAVVYGGQVGSEICAGSATTC